VWVLMESPCSFARLRSGFGDTPSGEQCLCQFEFYEIDNRYYESIK